MSTTAPTTSELSALSSAHAESIAWAEHSALFWARHLGGYSRRMRGRVDAYVLASAVISAITGATVWTTVANSTGVWAQALVMVFAVTATVVALVPKQLGYGEAADKASDLSVSYTHTLYALREAAAALACQRSGADKRAQQALELFEGVRAEKEHLRPYPQELQDAIEAERSQLSVHPYGTRVFLARG